MCLLRVQDDSTEHSSSRCDTSQAFKPVRKPIYQEHVCMHVLLQRCKPTHPTTYVQSCTHAWPVPDTRTHKHIHTRLSACLPVCLNVCRYACMQVCMYVCLYVCAYAMYVVYVYSYACTNPWFHPGLHVVNEACKQRTFQATMCTDGKRVGDTAVDGEVAKAAT